MTLFGVPDTDYDTMLRLTQALMEAQDPESGSAGPETMLEFYEYFRVLAENRRAEPRDDLASVIANAEIDGKPVGDLGTFGLYLIIATAGHDTTSSAVAGGMEALIVVATMFWWRCGSPYSANRETFGFGAGLAWAPTWLRCSRAGRRGRFQRDAQTAAPPPKCAGDTGPPGDRPAR